MLAGARVVRVDLDVDARMMRVEVGQARRDSDATVHALVGRTMPVGELATRMIVASSNLATNILVDLIGLDEARDDFDRLGVAGVQLLRGVEDELAWQAGINNAGRVSGDPTPALIRPIRPDPFSFFIL